MTHHRHLTDADILAYFEHDAQAVDLEAFEAAVRSCVHCRVAVEDLQDFTGLLREPSLWESIPPEPTHDELLQLASAEQSLTAEIVEARNFLAALHLRSVDQWPAILAANEHRFSEGLAHCLTEAAVELLDRDPADALIVLKMADQVAATLFDPVAVADHRGEIAKNEANALRMLGRYDEALDACDSAYRFGSDSPNGALTIANSIYTRATIFLKVGQFGEAAAAALRAATRFAEYGLRNRVIHARMVEAAARVEQGQVAEGLRTYESVLDLLAREGNPAQDDTVARVTANLGVCRLRLGQAALARPFADRALQLYESLGNIAEAVRTKWILGSIDIACGDHQSGVRLLNEAVADFTALDMTSDAAFVQLDLTEHYLREGEWSLAERSAREAASALAQARTKLHLGRALAYLRDAVSGRTATADLVSYVRSYVTTDDPLAEFSPPQPDTEI